MIHLAWVMAAAEPLATTGHRPALVDHPGWIENVEFQSVGLAIVMGTLLSLWFLTAAMGWAFRHATALREAKPEVPAEGTQSLPTQQSVPIAVIAAAVATVLDAPHHIISVRSEPDRAAWTLEGRSRHFASHKLR